MKIDQLIYFTETARLEHIGKASRVLGISTSAISHSITSLEGELGYDLFEKKGKNIVLTDQGRHLLNQSQELIGQFQNLKQKLLGANTEKMHFRIAASHHLAHQIVTSAWSKLAPSYPKVTLEIMTYRSSEVVRAVLEREIDYGICFSPQSHPELESNEIYQGELLLTVRKNHPLLKLKGANCFKALNTYQAVLPKAYQGIDLCIAHPMFDKFSIVPQANTLTDSYDISLELIRQSDSWGLTPDLLIRKNKSFDVIKPSGWRAPFNIAAIHLKKKFIPQFFNDLHDQLKLVTK